MASGGGSGEGNEDGRGSGGARGTSADGNDRGGRRQPHAQGEERVKQHYLATAHVRHEPGQGLGGGVVFRILRLAAGQWIF